MTKEEYVSQLTEIETQRSELFRRKNQLYADYRNEHKKFNPDDKVKITITLQDGVIREHIGYIKNVGIHDDGELFYQFFKPKKDGTKSSHNLYIDIWSRDAMKIELLEPSTTTLI